MPRQTQRNHREEVRVLPLSVPFTGSGDCLLEGGSFQCTLMLSALVPWCAGVVIVIDSDFGSLGHLRFLSNRDKGPKGLRSHGTVKLCHLMPNMVLLKPCSV